MTHDEMMQVLRESVEVQIDQSIATERDPLTHQALLRHRQWLVELTIARSEVETLKHQLQQAEQQRRPKQVHR